jgi:hypothetical protein
VSGSIRSDFFIWKAPFNHLIYALNRQAEISGLKTSVFKIGEHLIVVHTLVQVVALYSLTV